ncbi:MAG: nucleoside deaminase [Bdellovibrionales bacterium]|nr:nucleoside deaminase [Bdellovibrionales bacterium]
MSDEFYMKMALEYAEKAYSEGEVPVGALFVVADKVIAASHNHVEQCPGVLEHAELRVIREASLKLSKWRLIEGVLYSTLEPCVMCAAAIRMARISRVVYSAPDLRLGGFGSFCDFRNDRIFGPVPEVVSGLLAEQSKQLMQTFFRSRREKDGSRKD